MCFSSGLKLSYPRELIFSSFLLQTRCTLFWWWYLLFISLWCSSHPHGCGNCHPGDWQKHVCAQTTSGICFDSSCWKHNSKIIELLMIISFKTNQYVSSIWQTAIKRRNKPEPVNHWLDRAKGAYSDQLIEDTKIFLKVLVLYLPLPIYWALFDQQVCKSLKDEKWNHIPAQFSSKSTVNMP